MSGTDKVGRSSGDDESAGQGHVLVDHPLIKHKLALMRDEHCSSSKFRQLMWEISLIMAVYSTRDLEIENPPDGSIALNGPKPVIAAIVRAGLGMADAFLEIMPAAKLGHIGLQRTGKGELIQYLISLPDPEKDGIQRKFFILDPVIGTGSVCARAINIVKELGISGDNIRYITIVAALEGLSRVAEDHPDVSVYLADLAEGLDDDLHVRPSWGDASNKIFGIKQAPKRVGKR